MSSITFVLGSQNIKFVNSVKFPQRYFIHLRDKLSISPANHSMHVNNFRNQYYVCLVSFSDNSISKSYVGTFYFWYIIYFHLKKNSLLKCKYILHIPVLFFFYTLCKNTYFPKNNLKNYKGLFIFIFFSIVAPLKTNAMICIYTYLCTPI